MCVFRFALFFFFIWGSGSDLKFCDYETIIPSTTRVKFGSGSFNGRIRKKCTRHNTPYLKTPLPAGPRWGPASCSARTTAQRTDKKEKRKLCQPKTLNGISTSVVNPDPKGSVRNKCRKKQIKNQNLMLLMFCLIVKNTVECSFKTGSNWFILLFGFRKIHTASGTAQKE